MHSRKHRNSTTGMKIAIIGGGLTGLSAAYQLSKKGHTVTIFEKEKYLGGLAYGFKKPTWKWHLEAAYHHLFTNDIVILDLIKKLGLQKASGKPNTEKVGKLTKAQVEEIAKEKLGDLNTEDLAAAVKVISGTARSMGVDIEQ